jgi:hypothetical protein
MKLSQLFVDFLNEVNVSIPYIDTNKVALNVTGSQATSLTGFLATFQPLMAKYIDPTQHTTDVVHDVQTQYNVGHTLVAAIKQQIKHDKKVTLTSADIAAIGIHVDAARRHEIPTPNFAPANRDIKHTHLVTKIFTFNPQPGKEKETHMPEDVTKIARRLAVVQPAVTPQPGNYQHLPQVGSTIYDIVHTPEQEGYVGWLITNYVNPAGKEGPDSVPLVFRII